MKTNKKTTKKTNAKKPAKAVKPVAKAEPKSATEDKLAKRREYARAYYKANREKLVAASSRSHAKRAAEAKALLNEAFDMLQGIASEHGYEGLVRYGDPSVITRLADYLGKEA